MEVPFVFSGIHINNSYIKQRIALTARNEYNSPFFTIISLVQPDPPVDLKWTLLNVSLTGAYYDIMLSWKPPQSADVETGWMTLQYEVQYRDINSDLWEVVGVYKVVFFFFFCMC